MAICFEFIHSSASVAVSRLGTMEYNNVVESLMLISNTWNDLAKQSLFLGTLFNAVEWQQISGIVDNAQAFTSIFPENVFLEKRALLLRSLHTVYSCLRRVKKVQPTTHSNSSSNSQCNGDIHHLSSSGVSLHPAYDHICPLLPIVLKLTKTLHSFAEDPDLRYTLELSDGESSTVLGMYGHYHAIAEADLEKGKTPKEKIKVQYYHTRITSADGQPY